MRDCRSPFLKRPEAKMSASEKNRYLGQQGVSGQSTTLTGMATAPLTTSSGIFSVNNGTPAFTTFSSNMTSNSYNAGLLKGGNNGI